MKPVLVVGAGPVGLTAANSLARFGIPVKIIDSRPCPTALSKALVIWRRSLQTLDPLIPFEEWSTEHCRPVSGVDMADAGAIFASVNLKEPAVGSAATPTQHQLPAGLLCTQAAIEAGLEKHLKDTYGITVQRSTQLDSFTVDDTSGEVRCMLSTTVGTPAQHADLAAPAEAPITSSSGNQREVVVAFLIGCDGARSAVRKGLGIPFPGYSDAENRFLMVDCTYEHQPGINSHAPKTDSEGKPALDRLLANTTPVGIMASFPLVDKPGTIRMVWNAGERNCCSLNWSQARALRHLAHATQPLQHCCSAAACCCIHAVAPLQTRACRLVLQVHQVDVCSCMAPLCMTYPRLASWLPFEHAQQTAPTTVVVGSA